jgi:hypothetical protein
VNFGCAPVALTAKSRKKPEANEDFLRKSMKIKDMEYFSKLFLTAPKVAPTLAPESSDGFASVRTASHRKGRPVAGRPFCFVEKRFLN